MIALDFDGTVVNTIPDLTQLAAQVIEKHFGMSPEISIPLYRATLGVPFLAQLGELFPNNCIDSIAAAKEFELAKDKLVMTPFPGARELLATGLVVIVSSARTELLISFARRLSLDVQVFGARDGRENPKAEQLRLLAPSLFVGDAPRDAIFAAQAGCPFLAVEHTFSRQVFQELGLASVASLQQVYREAGFV